MRKGSRIILVLVVACSVALLTACASSQTPGSGQGSGTSGGTTVVEKNLTFSPQTLDVKVGDTVTFRNDDTAPHHVVFQDGTDLGEQQPGVSVTWKVAKAGSFPYKCKIHPFMTGTVAAK